MDEIKVVKRGRGSREVWHVLDRNGYTLCGRELIAERMIHGDKTHAEWIKDYHDGLACRTCNSELRKVMVLGKGRNPMLNVNESR